MKKGAMFLKHRPFKIVTSECRFSGTNRPRAIANDLRSFLEQRSAVLSGIAKHLFDT